MGLLLLATTSCSTQNPGTSPGLNDSTGSDITGEVVENPNTRDLTNSPETTPTSPPPLPGSLADNLKWQLVDKAQDPFWDGDRREEEICPPANCETETEHDGVWFTIETNTCGYLTISQPLIRDLHKGEEVRVRIWYFTITIGEGEALFHVALGADAELAWASSLDIPTEKGGLVMDTWVVPRDYAIGEPVYFNISNHGSNSWSLIELATISETTR